ncbi:MAG: helix-turn-helix transcriptional regulator [Spirochaetes bacterium]|nr:helix-turn-helix transcriptional regulator [Spirochaetota bacterium]
MDYVRECLSVNLKLRRAMMGLSQEGLAELSGLSAGYIANLETGRNYPSSGSLLKLSQALKVEHWRLLVDPEKDEIAYTRNELSMIFEKAKDLILGDLPAKYAAPRQLLGGGPKKD